MIAGALISTTLSCAPHAVAQTTAGPAIAMADFAVDSSGTCNNDELARIRGLPRLQVGYGYTFVIDVDAPLTTSSATSAESVTKSAELFERARIYGEDERSKKLLVKLGEGRICGWLSRAALLMSKTLPLRAADGTLNYLFGPRPVSVKDGPDGAVHPGNTLSMKVVIQNVYTSGEGRSIPVYAGPGSKIVRQQISLFDILEVFDWRKVAHPDNGRIGNYYLLGKRGAEGAAAGGELYGWVHDDDLYPWNSRMAAYWSGHGQAVGYGNQIDAVKASNYERKKGPAPTADPVMKGPQELPDSETIERAISRRFPILEQRPDYKDMDQSATTAELSKLVDYLYIAAPGKVCPKDGKGCVDANVMDQRRREVEEARERMATVDILFLIDATSSMEPYWPAAMAAVKKFAQSVDTIGTDVNIGAVVYGDYRGPVADVSKVSFRPFVRMHNPRDDPAAIDGLNSVKTIDDDQKDRLEAPFAAIIRAATLDDKWWRPEAGVKLIVHIADHGNREFGKTSFDSGEVGAKSTLVETISAEMVINALKSRGISYAPIAVIGTYLPIPNGKFVAQTSAISRALGRSGVPISMTYDPNKPVDPRFEDRTGTIYQRLVESVKASQKSVDYTNLRIQCAQSPSLPACAQLARIQNADWEGRFAANISESQLSDEQIKNIYGRGMSQTVVALYFPPIVGGNEVLSYWLAIEPAYLDELSSVTDKVCERFNQSNVTRSLQEMVLGTISDAGGEQYAGPSELFEKRYFIPAAHVLDFLKRPWQDIELDLQADKEAANKLRERICRSSFLLQHVLSGKRVNEATMKWNPKGYFTADREADFNWRYKPDRGVELYYLPLSYLP